VTPETRLHLQMTYVVTEADDEILCNIWFEEVSLTPEQLHGVFVRFADLYSKWPVVGQVRGAA
jgi:hypothetical protein